MPCSTLLSRTCDAVANALVLEQLDPAGIKRIPEPELANQVWQRFKLLTAPPPGQQLAPRVRQCLEHVARGFATFWRPHRLALTIGLARPPVDLRPLSLVSSQLTHLEVSIPSLTRLDWAAGLMQLVCLGLRGCTALPGEALTSLQPLASLRALDLCGLAQLGDDAAAPLASLAQLQVLHLGFTAVGDATLEALLYRHRAEAWAAQHGTALPEETAKWPPVQVRQLQLQGSRVTAAGLAHLALLPDLDVLDVRNTGISTAALRHLQQRFALPAVQSAVLSNSNALAMMAVNTNPIRCCCTAQERLEREPRWQRDWALKGVAVLLQATSNGLDVRSDSDSSAAAPPPGHRRLLPRKRRPENLNSDILQLSRAQPRPSFAIPARLPNLPAKLHGGTEPPLRQPNSQSGLPQQHAQ